MSKKLSSADKKIIEAQLSRFEKLATGKEFTLGKVKKGCYIHIYRSEKIGCFKRDKGSKNDMVFVFHHSHPKGEAVRVIGKLQPNDKRDKLTDKDIKSAICDTP